MSTLPKPLAGGLLMRWATKEDIEALAQFNINVHSDNPEQPEAWLGEWTRDLMNGRHPTTTASDFTVVTDENDGGKIVSSMNLISQIWAYDGIPFAVGRPELVGTHSDYRRKGLVRAQFDAIHTKSATRGELIQAITGIPWYYRQFDYEMAVDLGGGRNYFWDRTGNTAKLKDNEFTFRPAQADDIPHLQQLYESHNQTNLIYRIRSEEEWQYELFEPHRDSPYSRQVELVETAVSQKVVAYVEFKLWGQRFVLRELGVKPGYSWRPIVQAIMARFKAKADKLNKEREKPIAYLSFSMGQAHPAYEAADPQLEKTFSSYAWYIRLADVPSFLRHITPVLEERLASSILVNHSGKHRFNFFRSNMELIFENGRLKSVAPYKAKNLMDADAYFPDFTFLQLLFGRRSHQELKAAYPDCYMNADTAVLCNILFPKKASYIVGLG